MLHVDEVMLASKDKTEIKRQAQAWHDCSLMLWLKPNVEKSKYITTDAYGAGSTEINGTALIRKKSVKYLGSVIAPTIV